MGKGPERRIDVEGGVGGITEERMVGGGREGRAEGGKGGMRRLASSGTM